MSLEEEILVEEIWRRRLSGRSQLGKDHQLRASEEKHKNQNKETTQLSFNARLLS